METCPVFPPETSFFGKYRIERLLGRGGFAEVYLATHLHLNAPRALKVLVRGGDITTGMVGKVARRFHLEARLGAHFANEPHIVRVYDFEWKRKQGLLILVMEYMPGGSLKDRIRRAREQGLPGLQVDFVVRTAYHVALGLAALHREELVHRDVKPSNILYDAGGRAKIADLGIVQMPHGLTRRTELGEAAPRHPGTPEYMSPEQESTVTYLTPASDIYSLGITLFEALTLRRYKHLKPGTRLRALRPDAPPWLDELLARMLAEDPKARPWDGDELARYLKAYLEPAPLLFLTETQEFATASTADSLEEDERTLKETQEESEQLLRPLRKMPPPRREPVMSSSFPASLPARELPPIRLHPPSVVRTHKSAPSSKGVWFLALVLLLGILLFCVVSGTMLLAFSQSIGVPPEAQATWMPTSTPRASMGISSSPTTFGNFAPTSIPLLTPSPTATPTAAAIPTATATPALRKLCDEAPPSPLHVGQKAYVCTRQDRVRLRFKPGIKGRHIAWIAPGTRVDIVDGYECGNGWVWWYVQVLEGPHQGKRGWMAEGGDSKDPKFLCPLEEEP